MVFISLLILIVTVTKQCYIVIMGGDGSLGQTIKELRSYPAIDEHINRFTFCLLPFGTGNDTGQVFGWGSKLYMILNFNIRLARKVGVKPGHAAELPHRSQE